MACSSPLLPEWSVQPIVVFKVVLVAGVWSWPVGLPEAVDINFDM